MSLKVYPQMEQRSEAWYEARRGIVTASMVGKLVATESLPAETVACPKCDAETGSPCVSLSAKARTPIKTFHDDRRNAVATLPPVVVLADNDTSRAITASLVAERVAGFSEDTPMTADMWRGVEQEPAARAAYAEREGVEVKEVGFMVRNLGNGMKLGYSPDGLVGKDGLLEIKCPRAKSNITTVLADEVPAHHMAQLQAGLFVSGRKWIDFVPYVGGLPLWSKRIHPDPKWRGAIVAAVALYETTAAQMVAAYNAATEGLPRTERISYDIEVAA